MGRVLAEERLLQAFHDMDDRIGKMSEEELATFEHNLVMLKQRQRQFLFQQELSPVHGPNGALLALVKPEPSQPTGEGYEEELKEFYKEMWNTYRNTDQSYANITYSEQLAEQRTDRNVPSLKMIVDGAKQELFGDDDLFHIDKTTIAVCLVEEGEFHRDSTVTQETMDRELCPFYPVGMVPSLRINIDLGQAQFEDGEVVGFDASCIRGFSFQYPKDGGVVYEPTVLECRLVALTGEGNGNRDRSKVEHARRGCGDSRGLSLLFDVRVNLPHEDLEKFLCQTYVLDKLEHELEKAEADGAPQTTIDQLKAELAAIKKEFEAAKEAAWYGLDEVSDGKGKEEMEEEAGQKRGWSDALVDDESPAIASESQKKHKPLPSTQ